jgi:hypothetical protein
MTGPPQGTKLSSAQLGPVGVCSAVGEATSWAWQLTPSAQASALSALSGVVNASVAAGLAGDAAVAQTAVQALSDVLDAGAAGPDSTLKPPAYTTVTTSARVGAGGAR